MQHVSNGGIIVSILVLMEVKRESSEPDAVSRAFQVSILVLMEVKRECPIAH